MGRNRGWGNAHLRIISVSFHFFWRVKKPWGRTWGALVGRWLRPGCADGPRTAEVVHHASPPFVGGPRPGGIGPRERRRAMLPAQ